MGTLVDSLKPVGSMTRSSVADGVAFQEEIIGPLTENRNTIWNYLSQYDLNSLEGLSASAAKAYSMYQALSGWMPGNDITVEDILASAKSGASADIELAKYNLTAIKASAELGYNAWTNVAPYKDKFAGIQGSAQSGQSAYNVLATVKSNWNDIETSAALGLAASSMLTSDRKKEYEYLTANYIGVGNSAKSAANTYGALYNTSTGMYNKWIALNRNITDYSNKYDTAYKTVTGNSANWTKLTGINASAALWDSFESYISKSATLLNNTVTSVSNNESSWTKTYTSLTSQGFSSGTSASSFSGFWSWMAGVSTATWNILTGSDLTTKQGNWNAAYNGIANAGNWNDSVTYAKSASLWNSVKSYNMAATANTGNWNAMYDYITAKSATISSNLSNVYNSSSKYWTALGNHLTSLTSTSEGTYIWAYNRVYNKTLNTNSANWQCWDVAYTNASIANAFVISLSTLSGNWNTVKNGTPTRTQLNTLSSFVYNNATNFNGAYSTVTSKSADWKKAYDTMYATVRSEQGGKYTYSRLNEYTTYLIDSKWSHLSGKANDYVSGTNTVTGVNGNWAYKLTLGTNSSFINNNKSKFSAESFWKESNTQTQMNEAHVNKSSVLNGMYAYNFKDGVDEIGSYRTNFSSSQIVYVIG